MVRKHNTIYLILILVLGLFVFTLSFPQYINKGIDFVKPKVEKIPILRLLPKIPEKEFKLGLDLQGGSHLVYEADLTEIDDEEQDEAMQGLRDVIERRVNLFGVGEPVVVVNKVGESRRLVIELPGVHDTNKAIKMIGKTPFLEFKQEAPAEESERIIKEYLKEEASEDIDANAFCSSSQFVTAFIQEFQVDPCYISLGFTGKYLDKSSVSFDNQGIGVAVLLDFDKEGSDLFEKLTEDNIGKRIAIFIDDILISAPNVNEAISGGSARITGTFTVDEATELARNLNAGALPVPIELIAETTVGPTLGKISLNRSLMAGIFGLFCIILFMLVFYRFSGLLAGVSLLIYAGILLALFKFIPVTLTLAGIGGAVLSIGMAVDANVLIFERQKEELKKGESFQRATEIGFSRAWSSIRDSNFTTLIVAAIMFMFGTSFVKGFALTLSLGILVSMFSSMIITRTFMRAFVSTKLANLKWLWK